MAYNTGNRFPTLPHSFRLLEPGSYQGDNTHKIKHNKAPFLSRSKRNTLSGNRIWTHAIYYAEPHRKIPNCTSLMSKKTRFPYEALSKEDIEAILCRCGLQNVCECPDKNIEAEVNCQAKIHKRLYKGPPPRIGSEGLSVPSRRDRGFEQMPDGSHKRIYKTENDLGPLFYDPEVIESTAFYRGWKWSQWKSKREMKDMEKRPGPADYTLEKHPNQDEICAEKFREKKRKYSKQLRYIEMIQRKDLLEQRPGPASYNPKYSKDPDFKYSGSKAARYRNSNTVGPGPAAYWIKRDCDLSESPTIVCQARLPEPACFGVKAKRFKPRKEEGPSPATYYPNDRQCRFLNCFPPPFGSSARRFKDTMFEDDDDDEVQDEITDEKCLKTTWEFKSKTIRMKPLEKKHFEQSPADVPMRCFYPKRIIQLQNISPFCSSEGRFQPWYNWLSVFGHLKTPGPGYYNLEKYKCMPAVCHGPIYKADRFLSNEHETPAPNEYKIGGGVETILATHNIRLKQNLETKHKFHWEPPSCPNKLSLIEQEDLILDKLITAFEDGIDAQINNNETSGSVKLQSNEVVHGSGESGVKSKLLHYFLYKHPVKLGF